MFKNRIIKIIVAWYNEKRNEIFGIADKDNEMVLVSKKWEEKEEEI